MAIYSFHVSTGMPEAYKRPIYEGRLRYLPHALKESKQDQYGQITLPAIFNASEARLIEADFCSDKDRVIKQVWRQPLDKTRDLVLVISEGGKVKTVWINLKTDKHKTLNTSRYVKF